MTTRTSSPNDSLVLVGNVPRDRIVVVASGATQPYRQSLTGGALRNRKAVTIALLSRSECGGQDKTGPLI